MSVCCNKHLLHDMLIQPEINTFNDNTTKAYIELINIQQERLLGQRKLTPLPTNSL